MVLFFVRIIDNSKKVCYNKEVKKKMTYLGRVIIAEGVCQSKEDYYYGYDDRT